MTRPTSFRLPDDLLARVDAEAIATGTSVTSLVTSLLDEGLKSRRFAGVVYRNGPAGRRAGLAPGPGGWGGRPGGGQRRLHGAAGRWGVALDEVRLAVEFYAAFPDEIDARIAADEQAQLE